MSTREHPITIYRRRNNLTLSAFARQVELPASTVHRIAKGDAVATIPVIRKIVRATGGTITVEAMVNWDPGHNHQPQAA